MSCTKQKLLLGERRRELVAYYKIALGMTIKECASMIGSCEKTADYYWRVVKQRIRSPHRNHRSDVIIENPETERDNE